MIRGSRGCGTGESHGARVTDMSAMLSIVADHERRSAPRPIRKPAPVKSQLLFWLSHRTLCAQQLAERTGVDVDTVRVHLVKMRLDKQIFEVYRRVVEHEIDGAGRKRHLVRYYKARLHLGD